MTKFNLSHHLVLGIGSVLRFGGLVQWYSPVSPEASENSEIVGVLADERARFVGGELRSFAALTMFLAPPDDGCCLKLQRPKQ